MLTYRFLMFKMRELTHIQHKIMHFKHYTPQNDKFFPRKLHILDKNN